MSKRETEREEAVGLECPRCGCREFRTTKTMRLRDGTVRRYKQCEYCGRPAVSYEALTRRELSRAINRGS